MADSLYELKPDCFILVRPLYAGITDHRPIVFSVIEGLAPGRVWVDHPEQPSAALVLGSGGELFLSGASDNAAFNQAARGLILADLIPIIGEHVLIYSFSPEWKATLDELFREQGVMRVTRCVFALDRARFQQQQAGWRDRIPEGFRLQQVNRQLAGQIGEIEPLWGSLDNFMANGFAYAITRKDQVVSRTCAVFRGDNWVEIGIETDKAHRRRGLATLTACAFIEHCLETGLQFEWSCWDVNVPSCQLAARLGFVQQADVQVHYLHYHA